MIGQVAWQIEARQPLTGGLQQSYFSDVDEINTFPRCLKPLFLPFKLCGFFWHDRKDMSIGWTMWSWFFRIMVILFGIMITVPDIFVGSLSLAVFMNETSHFIIKASLISAIISYEIASIYPLWFCCYYIQKGSLHQVLKTLLSTKYITKEFLTKGLFNKLYKSSKQCRNFIIITLIFQYVGWMIVNNVENPKTLYYQAFSNIVWPFMWTFFKFAPFVCGVALFFIVLKILRYMKDIYIAQIAISHVCYKCRNKCNQWYFIFHDIDTSNVTPLQKTKDIENHLYDSYLNLVGLCNATSKHWRTYTIILCLNFFCSLLSAISLIFYCDRHPIGTTIMMPSTYLFISFFLLYQLADINGTSDSTKALLSATRFNINDDDIDSDNIDNVDNMNKKKCISINQMLKMMEYNPVEITIGGVTVDESRVNAGAIAIATIIGTGFIQYYFPQLTTI